MSEKEESKTSWKDSLVNAVKTTDETLKAEIIKSIHDSDKELNQKTDPERKHANVTIRTYIVLSYIAKVALGFIGYLKIKALLEVIRIFIPIP